MEKLESEDIVIESPMSFTGATKRIWRVMEFKGNVWVKWLVIFPAVVLTLYFVYSFIFVWYLVFGLFLVPFRLLRRSSRKKQVTAAQHRELMTALSNRD